MGGGEQKWLGRRERQRRMNGEGRREGVGEARKGRKEAVGDEERAQLPQTVW